MAKRSATIPFTEEEGRRMWEKSRESVDIFAKYARVDLRGTSECDIDKYLLGKYGPKVRENSRLYEKLVRNTEGFDAGHWTWQELTPSPGIIVSCEIDGDVELAAKFAISTLNSQLETEERICFQEVIRVTRQLVAGVNYFITMKASDGNFYEAKVYRDTTKKFKTFIMRIAKHYPVTDPEILQLKMAEHKMSESEAGGSGSRR